MAQAQDDVLFEITRNRDAHKIIYHVNTDREGTLDREEPISAYWRRVDGDESRSKSLNMLEKRYAYGLEFLEADAERARFRFVSYKKREFVLRKDDRGNFAVFAEIGGSMEKLASIFIHLDGGTFWFPRISFIRLIAVDKKGSPIEETIYNP